MLKSLLPTKSQWGQFFKILNKKERRIFLGFTFLTIISFLVFAREFYLNHTEEAAKEGGSYAEGLIGSPRFINPIYSAPSDVDRDLTELMYSGLMKYDGEDKIVPDLAKSYEVLEDGKIYEFTLKDDLLWSDSKPLTVDDVIFTIETIQNPAVKSPERAKWLGVSIEKISDNGVRFELKNPSAIFLENCTLKIIPQHIWEEVSVQNFPLSIYNLKPVGSGPYKLKELKQDNQGNIESIELTRNANYYNTLPNITKLVFKFFRLDNSDSEKSNAEKILAAEKKMIKAAKSGEIDAFTLSSQNLYQDINTDKFTPYNLTLPRYFSVFFNQNPPNDDPKLLADENIREALNYGTDKEAIIETVLAGYGERVDSPILPDNYHLSQPEVIYETNLAKAKELLDTAGFIEKDNGKREKYVQDNNGFQFTSNLTVGSQGNEVSELQKCLNGTVSGYFGSQTKAAVIQFQEKYKEDILIPNGLSSGNGVVKASTRAKLNEVCFPPSEETIPLSFTLTTVDDPILKQVANLLKSQWEELGAEVSIETFDVSSQEQDVIKSRNYEMLLFGEVLGIIPDPFPFWHSSQVKDPGLNLAGYKNNEADELLETARQDLDEQSRKEALEEFQDILLADVPVLFLYSPDYIYFVSPKIKGVESKIIADTSKRFTDIGNWYIKTKRVW